MKHYTFPVLPLKLQFFAEGDGAEPQAPTVPPVPPAAPTAQPTQPEPPKEKPQDIAAAILAAVEAATQKKEKTVVKSMAEQYGLSDDEANKALEAERAKKAAQLPPEIKAQMDAALKAANDRLIAAEVKTLGIQMGLVDADVAVRLLDATSVTVAQDGAVTGVQAALDALKVSKPYLFTPAQQEPPAPAPTGQKGDVGGAVTPTNDPDYSKMDDAAFYRTVLAPKA